MSDKRFVLRTKYTDQNHPNQADASRLADSEQVALLADVASLGPQAPSLRAIFDAGRQLGLNLSQPGPWDAEKMALALTDSNLPCVGGTWRQHVDGAWKRVRRPDASCLADRCHAWREALDGLVMGAGDTLRYSRHSQGSDPFGAEKCVDVLYDVRDAARWRWADVPAKLEQRLQPLLAQLAKTQAVLKLHGYAEGTLFAQIEDQHPQLGGHRYGLLLESIQRFIAREIPEISLREMSPQAVWTGD